MQNDSNKICTGVPSPTIKGTSLFFPSLIQFANSFAAQSPSTPPDSPTCSSLPRAIERPRRSDGSSFPPTAKRSPIAAAFAQLIPNVFLAETLKSRKERLSRLHRVVVPSGSPRISDMQEESEVEEEEEKEEQRKRRRNFSASPRGLAIFQWDLLEHHSKALRPPGRVSRLLSSWHFHLVPSHSTLSFGFWARREREKGLRGRGERSLVSSRFVSSQPVSSRRGGRAQLS